jgi:hypothetical protein
MLIVSAFMIGSLLDAIVSTTKGDVDDSREVQYDADYSIRQT